MGIGKAGDALESAGNLLKPARSSNGFLGWGHTSSSEIYRISSKVRGTSSLCSSWFFVKHLKKFTMMLLIFFLLIIFSAGLLITWMHYQQQKTYNEKIEQVMNAQLENAESQAGTLAKVRVDLHGVAQGVSDLNTAITFGPREANEQMVAYFTASSSPEITGIKLSPPNGERIPLYAFTEQLEAAGMSVFSQVRKDAMNNYEANLYWLYVGTGELEAKDSIVLRFEVVYFPLSRLMDSENLKKYTVGDEELPCIDGVSAFVIGECAAECQTTIITQVIGILKNCTGVKFIPNPTEGNIFVHRINEEGRIVHQRMSYNNFDKAFFDAAYTELRTRGTEVKSVLASKLLQGLLKTWAKTRCNICIFGSAGTGKSTLLKALAKMVSDTQDMKVLSISGRDFAKHFSNPTFTSNLSTYWQNEKIIVLIDEFHSLNIDETASIKSVLDGFDSMENVSFVLATNEEDFNDQAITRHGRMEMLLSITPFANRNDAENLYNLLVQQDPEVRWQPFPTEYKPMTLADIVGLKRKASLWDAIQ